MRSRTTWRTRTDGLLALWLAVALVAGLCAGASAQTDTSEPEQPVPGEERAAVDYAPFPQPDAGYVTDLAELLSDAEEERIERWLWQVESKTGVEIVVMTLRSIRQYPAAPHQSIEQFATGLFDKYGIGNMPKNDGVLLLVAVDDRKARIELGAGYGRERDDDAARIMNRVITPRFKKGEYAEGITDGVKAVMLEFARVRVGINWPLIILIAAIPIVGLIAYSLFKSGKRGWGWVCVGFLIILIMAAIYVLIKTLKHAPRGSSKGWSAGGFGGGFSGGGGATGSW